ncbi:MAG TPA: class I SAM-dependent methyltransferase [Solirubrobacterales bacterium]|nr:class I SAM-dependent methyltransferase [Solirubrobacterales bacterium]
MRLGAIPESLIERIGLLLGKVPTPVGEAMFGMPVARSLQVAQRTGILGALAEGPRDPAELAEHLGLQPTGTLRLLDVVATLGHVKQNPDGTYEMTASGRRWLDPKSDTYIGDFLADTYEYWDWYARLEDLVRDGHHIELHEKAPDDPYWQSYIRGQYQMARLSSAEVAKAIPLAGGAEAVLDVAGAHGEFSMALCRRHEGLRATVVDLPGSARVGEEIVREAGMGDRVRHIVGDMFEVDYDGTYDGALCFNIVHHLSPEQARALFARIRASLRPGAPLCILDLYDRPSGQRAGLASILGLFFHLTSGADTYTTDEVGRWMGESGYGSVDVKSFRTLPDLYLLVAKAA